jgi:hypothetical protein
MEMYGVDAQINVFLTSALVGGEWLASRPAALTPGIEPPVPTGKEAGWAPEPVRATWRRVNSCPSRDSNSDPSVVQPVASRYTDCALPALEGLRQLKNPMTSSGIEPAIFRLV